MITLRKKPLLLHYFVTTACNCCCGFCDIHRRPAQTAMLPDVLDNLRKARKLGAWFADFTGGEPLLFKALPEVLREARKLGFVTSVTTNGILLAARAQELAGLIDLPRVSLDGTKAIHNRLRGADCFDAVLEGLAAARKAGLRPDILFTLTEENQGEIEGVYTIARRFRTQLILDPAFSYFNNPSYASLDALLRRWSRHRHVYVNGGLLKLRAAGGNSTTRPACRVMDAVIVIGPDNRLLVPCYHHAQEGLPIRNDLDTLWKSEPVRALRKKQGRFPFCEGCAINCYLDPSFCFRADLHFLHSMLPKAKYALNRWLLPF
ncbi:MAG: radical SAM protein [Fibrobacterota bacterium]